MLSISKEVPNDASLHSHLGMLQSVISRMAQNSANAKTWSISIAAAMGALSIHGSMRDGWIATLPVLTFWYLDSYYLRQEKLFRALFQAAADRRITLFSMDTGPFKPTTQGILKSSTSITILPIHGALLIGTLLRLDGFSWTLKIAHSLICH